MTGFEFAALAVAAVLIVAMVMVTRNAAASRKGKQDSADAGSSWDDFGGSD